MYFVGDMGFDGTASMIQDAHLDDSLYKNSDAAFLLGETDGFHGEETHPNDKPLGVEFDAAAAAPQDDNYASGPDDYGNLLHKLRKSAYMVIDKMLS